MRRGSASRSQRWLPVERLGSTTCKGTALAAQPRRGLSHLIYPLPVHAGLGVHLTLDLGGRAGPDTQYIDQRLRVDPTNPLLAAIDTISRHRLRISARLCRAGPQLQGPGGLFDFSEESSAHGLPGFVSCSASNPRTHG